MPYTGTNTKHATYNWNPLYDSYTHVALWGNDATGDGSKKYPYRTITRAIVPSVTNNIVVGSMTIRESITTLNATVNIVADGNVIIDTSTDVFWSNFGDLSLTGINCRGNGTSVLILNRVFIQLVDCVLDGCGFVNPVIKGLDNSSFKNISGDLYMGFNGSSTFSNNTFYDCSSIAIGGLTTLNKNIFSDSTIKSFPTTIPVKYSNFYNTSINFGNGPITYTTFNAFSSDYLTQGGSLSNLISVYFLNPLFNNVYIGDLTLAIDSPAKNMASDGGLIGANSIAAGLTGSANPINSAFDNSSAVNITIDALTGALTLTDNSLNASIVTKPIANLKGRNILKINTNGFYSDRNGEYIDSTPDIDLTGTYIAGDTLDVNCVYIVDDSGGQVTYNGNNYAVGDRLVCNSAATTFSNTSVDSYLREIIEAPTRNNIEARFSNGTGVFKSIGDVLTTNHWYFISNGDGTTYDGTLYANDSFIKGTGNIVSSLDGIIEEVFTTDPYKYYETIGQLTCNRSGNVFTGDITLGNGDPNFDRTPANVFKISSKFMQARYTIQVNNLTP